MWRIEEPSRPKVMSQGNVLLALGLHIGAFAGFWLFAVCHGLFEKKEEIIPIDLTVIVNENLDGKENEPPPLLNPTKPTPPPPKPKVREEPKKIEDPKPLEQMVIEKKTPKKPEKKPPEPVKKPGKKEPPKPPEKPKKTKEELLKERMERMRSGVKKVKIEVPKARLSGDGRTEKKTLSDAEIMKRLNEGYRPGTTEQLTNNEVNRCASLLKMAIEDKWEFIAPKVGKSGDVVLAVRLNSSGGIASASISQSCGDRLSDAAALDVVRRVTAVAGLSADFIARFRKETLKIRYHVKAR